MESISKMIEIGNVRLYSSWVQKQKELATTDIEPGLLDLACSVLQCAVGGSHVENSTFACF